MSPCHSISLTSFFCCDVESLIALLLMWSISPYVVAVLSWWILPSLLFFGDWLRFLVTSMLLIRKDDRKALAKINKEINTVREVSLGAKRGFFLL